MNGRRRPTGIGLPLAALLCLMIAASVIEAPTGAPAGAAGDLVGSPIQHVVVIDEENHSFDNLLGDFCVRVARGQIVRDGANDPCAGTNRGVLSDGTSFLMKETPDAGISVAHGESHQIHALDGGEMDGFSDMPGCRADSSPAYSCLTQFHARSGSCGKGGNRSCIRNLVRWATTYALSDMTFQYSAAASWTGHLALGAATDDGFTGDNPKERRGDPGGGPGWGCDSGKSAIWWNGAAYQKVPSCVPDATGSLGPVWGGYTGVRADHVPTIMDRLDQFGISWKIYGGTRTTDLTYPNKGTGYGWTICPTFASCQYSAQQNRWVASDEIRADAEGGTLPKVSFVTPTEAWSQHEPASTVRGDNWLGRVMHSIMSGPDWSSTAVFLTWDDCGCFYDHVNPLRFNPTWAFRVPMVIISPWAKPGYTDSTPTTFVSVLTFIEHMFALPPLNPCATIDAGDPQCTDDLAGPGGGPAYDYANSFDFTQTQLHTTPSVSTALPPGERRMLPHWEEIVSRQGT